jgi:hypothetical protein
MPKTRSVDSSALLGCGQNLWMGVRDNKNSFSMKDAPDGAQVKSRVW